MEDLGPQLDRKTIRALAEKNFIELQEVADAGGNHYQTSLDQQDRINEFVAKLSEDDAIFFMNIYAEELEACANKIMDDANNLLMEAEIKGQEAEIKGQNAEVVGGVIGVIILFLIFFLVFK